MSKLNGKFTDNDELFNFADEIEISGERFMFVEFSANSIPVLPLESEKSIPF
jgi:hypothetical protein